MPNNTVFTGYEYFADPDVGRPIFNGKIYVGNIDVDPRIVLNQKSASLTLESGVTIPISQPIRTNQGGYAVDGGGSIGKITVEGEYSIAVDDANDVEQIYNPNVTQGVPINTEDGFIQPYADYSAFRNDVLAPTLPDGTRVEFISPKGSYFYLEKTGVSIPKEDGGNYIISNIDPDVFIRRHDFNVVNIKSFGAVGDDLAADNAAFAAAIVAAKKLSSTPTIYIPAADDGKSYRLERGHDISNLTIYGDGKRSSRIEFNPLTSGDCLTTQFQTQIRYLWLGGGRDGSALQVAESIINMDGATVFGGEITVISCVIRQSKGHLIRMRRVGYVRCFDIEGETSNMEPLNIDGLEDDGFGNSLVVTTASFHHCKFSSATNGHNIRINDGQAISFFGCVFENGNGVAISGTVTGPVSFTGCYAEFPAQNTPTNKFIELTAGGIIGLLVTGCFGGVKEIDYNPSIFNAAIFSNRAIVNNAVTFNNYIRGFGSQGLSAVLGGINVVVTSVTIPAGSWDIYGRVQTANDVGATAMETSTLITNNIAEFPRQIGTTAVTYREESDQSIGNLGVTSTNCFLRYRNDTGVSQTAYLVSRINSTTGSFSYNGSLVATPTALPAA